MSSVVVAYNELCSDESVTECGGAGKSRPKSASSISCDISEWYDAS